jgi:hypothetical protein
MRSEAVPPQKVETAIFFHERGTNHREACPVDGTSGPVEEPTRSEGRTQGLSVGRKSNGCLDPGTTGSFEAGS